MRRRKLTLTLLLLASVTATGCGTEGVELASNERDPAIQRGAEIFYNRCGACHTMSAAGQQGSSSNVNSREYKDGPNFNQRAESAEDVLYAIQNGGFSSGPMPQQILTGERARAVAEFVEKYSGQEAERPPDPQGGNPRTPPGAEAPEDTQ